MIDQSVHVYRLDVRPDTNARSNYLSFNLVYRVYLLMLGNRSGQMHIKYYHLPSVQFNLFANFFFIYLRSKFFPAFIRNELF